MMIRGNSSVQYMEKQKSPLKRGLLFSVLSFFSFWSSPVLSLILEHAQETFPLSVIPHFRTSLRNIFSFRHPSFWNKLTKHFLFLSSLVFDDNQKHQGIYSPCVIPRNAFALCYRSFTLSRSSLETLLRFVKGSTKLFNPKIAGRFC